jgi:hypothetical protein
MSDYIAAEITIGGNVKRSLVRSLCRAISSQRVALDWGETLFQPESAQDLLAALTDVNGVKLLKLCDDQARWGQFEELEWFLEKHQIAFRRHSDGRYEYDSDLVEYRPGLGRVYSLASKSGEPLVSLGLARQGIAALSEVQKLLRRKQSAEAVRIIRSGLRSLRSQLPHEVPPLKPFTIN